MDLTLVMAVTAAGSSLFFSCSGSAAATMEMATTAHHHVNAAATTFADLTVNNPNKYALRIGGELPSRKSATAYFIRRGT